MQICSCLEYQRSTLQRTAAVYLLDQVPFIRDHCKQRIGHRLRRLVLFQSFHCAQQVSLGHVMNIVMFLGSWVFSWKGLLWLSEIREKSDLKSLSHFYTYHHALPRYIQHPQHHWQDD